MGTLLGAALGSMYSCSSQQAQVKLRRLTNLFIEVDQRVALTKTLKAAVKDVGIRSRGASMNLSPNTLRKMVRAGSRQDPGSAITGAPPALIDAISDLFLIPYRATARIAAEFVAGHVTRATHTFWTQIKTETIDRLGIYDALIWSSLLERETRLVLGDIPQDVAQPFLEQSRIAFFATAVNLVTEWITILGAQLAADRYDLIEALLASAAFPMAFAPRRASALYPGVGRRDVFYGDGGMFDNLPFTPAFEVLREVQMDRLQATARAGQVARGAGAPASRAGSISRGRAEYPADGGRAGRPTIRCARSRPARHPLKTTKKSTGWAAIRQIDRQLGQLRAAAPGDARLPGEQEELLNGIVNAAVMPVYPADAAHLKGTYEFCAAMGMDRDRIRRSIADGCFQTMLKIARAQEETPHSMTSRSVAALTAMVRVPGIVIEHDPAAKHYGCCPFFIADGGGGNDVDPLSVRRNARNLQDLLGGPGAPSISPLVACVIKCGAGHIIKLLRSSPRRSARRSGPAFLAG